MKHFRAAKNTCQKALFCTKRKIEKKFVILLLHTDKRLCVVSLSSLCSSSSLSSSLEKAIYLSCSFSPLEAMMMMMMRARSSFGCSTSSSLSSFSLPFLTTRKNRMGLKRFNSNNNKKNNNNNNKSMVVSIRAGEEIVLFFIRTTSRTMRTKPRRSGRENPTTRQRL